MNNQEQVSRFIQNFQREARRPHHAGDPGLLSAFSVWPNKGPGRPAAIMSDVMAFHRRR